MNNLLAKMDLIRYCCKKIHTAYQGRQELYCIYHRLWIFSLAMQCKDDVHVLGQVSSQSELKIERFPRRRHLAATALRRGGRGMLLLETSNKTPIQRCPRRRHRAACRRRRPPPRKERDAAGDTSKTLIPRRPRRGHLAAAAQLLQLHFDIVVELAHIPRRPILVVAGAADPPCRGSHRRRGGSGAILRTRDGDRRGACGRLHDEVVGGLHGLVAVASVGRVASCWLFLIHASDLLPRWTPAAVWGRWETGRGSVMDR